MIVLPREEKVQLVNNLRDDIQNASAMYLTDYRGLTVSEMAALRRSLRESGAEYKVVKNTLFKLALEGIADSHIAEILEGPTAVAFVRDDPISPARTILDFMKDHETLSVKGGYMEGRFYDPAQVVALSKIPPQEILLAQLVGSVQAPVYGLVSTLQGVVSSLVYTLQAVADKKAA